MPVGEEEGGRAGGGEGWGWLLCVHVNSLENICKIRVLKKDLYLLNSCRYVCLCFFRKESKIEKRLVLLERVHDIN